MKRGKKMGSISIVGLGPSDGGLITRQTWSLMEDAQVLYIRTEHHPAVEAVKKAGIEFKTYDDFYDNGESFDVVYEEIANDIVKKAQDGMDIVYAVPGSPLVAEKTVLLIKNLAYKNNVPIKIYSGMSFLELIYTQLGIDPIDGLCILDSFDLDKKNIDTSVDMIITQLYSKHTASEVKLTLMDHFPDEHEVVLLYHLGLPDEKITRVCLYELDRQNDIDYLTSLYVPRHYDKKTVFTMKPLSDIIHTLRSPEGCPWDIIQTHKSLRRNLIEEVYEVIEAIDLNDSALLCEELGDLLMQIVFHARMAEESGDFSMQDVINGVSQKLVHRHPHVFGDVSVEDAGEVLLNWEAIKRQEKKDRKSVLDGVPKDLPALMSAYKLQNKAAKVGFDWEQIDSVWDKLGEEITELKMAAAQDNKTAIEEELGDVLFTVVNLSRFMDVDAEVSLINSNRKFCRRFSYIEKQLKKQNRDWQEFTLVQLDELWNQAKQQE